MGHPRQFALSADGIRTAIAPFREESRAGSVAKVPSPRLEGRLHIAGDGVVAFQFSRQHCSGVDWWRDGASDFPRQSAYRLSGRNRRRIECRRLLECRGRHHDHDDVDCRRLTDPSLPRERCCHDGTVCFRYSGGHQATQVFAYSRARSRTHQCGLGTDRHRWADSYSRACDQRYREYEVPRAHGSFSVHRDGSLVGNPHVRGNTPSGLGSAASGVAQLHFSALAGANRLDDAGGTFAAGLLAYGLGPWFFIRCV